MTAIHDLFTEHKDHLTAGMPELVFTSHEPEDGNLGSYSVRTGEFGSELCYAAGPECGTWYVRIHPIVAEAVGLEDRPVYSGVGRDDARHLVELIGRLYERATAVATEEEPDRPVGTELCQGFPFGISILALLFVFGVVDA